MLVSFLEQIIQLLKEIKPVFFQKQTTQGINQPWKQFLLQTGRHSALRIYLQQAFVMVVLPSYLTPPPPPPERNLMVTELIKTVESFHPAKKMKNLFNICYVLQKHFESRLCYKLIKKIKNIKKKFLRILKKILKTSKKCKSFESSRNNIIKIISKIEIIFALYSMSFVFHLYSFYCVLCCTWSLWNNSWRLFSMETLQSPWV